MKLSINEELKKSIEQAVLEQKQPEKLAQRIVAWLNEMSQRELTKNEHSRYLEGVRSAIIVADTGAEE